MTTQEAYDKIRAHFSQPNAVFGYDHSEMVCVYRGRYENTNPVRCAFGVLIDDEDYYEAMEGNSVTTLLIGDGEDISPYLAPGKYADLDLGFLERVQETHDHCATTKRSVTAFLGELDQLAKLHDLTVPVS